MEDHSVATGKGLKAVTLAGDTVIPPEAVRETLSGADVEEWERAIPLVLMNHLPSPVGEKADAPPTALFGRLFDKAARFLS
ncbi:MAG: hypothetical protein R2758_03745 [Bacteroidales bacterium]